MIDVGYTQHGDIAVINLCNPPVNALSLEHRIALADAIGRAARSDSVKAILLTGSGKGFAAGADISQFASGKNRIEPRAPTLQKLLIESGKLTVAAIHGFCLGGGLELALACDARVGVANSKLGFPEVNLGLLPGGGGTQRFTRIAGPQAAIDLLTTGRLIGADAGLSLGIIDAIIKDPLRDGMAFVREALAGDRRFIPALDRKATVANPEHFFIDARRRVEKKARGALAPSTIVDCIEAACYLSAEEGLAVETAKFDELASGEQSSALIHLFFAERAARDVPGLPSDTTVLPIRKVAVIGAGTMGAGIAMVFANGRCDVQLLDVDPVSLTRGREAIAQNYATSVARGSTSQKTVDEAMARIRATTDYADLGDVDLVVEAAFEDMAVKKRIFAALDAATPQRAILATNTSSLDIDAIAASTSRPQSVIGMHFFSPANVMKLLEVVRGTTTSAETIKTAMAIAGRINKVPVLARNCDGFIGNRMLQYYTSEAEFLLEEGATPEQIDNVATSFGMAIGPLAMRDMAGLDVGLAVRRARLASFPPEERVPTILDKFVAAGRLGAKSGKGFYRYEGRERFADAEALSMIRDVAREIGVAQRDISNDEIRDRLFLPLVNEGAKIIDEGIAIRASDIDVVYTNGYGFPAFRGGPMYWGERFGLDRVEAMAKKLAARSGPRWAPATLISRLVQARKGFSD